MMPRPPRGQDDAIRPDRRKRDTPRYRVIFVIFRHAGPGLFPLMEAEPLNFPQPPRSRFRAPG